MAESESQSQGAAGRDLETPASTSGADSITDVNKQHEENSAIFDDYLRQKLSQMKVDPAFLHEALSSEYYLEYMCNELASCIRIIDLKMFLRRYQLVSELHMEDIQLQHFDPQDMTRALLRQMRMQHGSTLNPRTLIHMAHSYEQQRIYDNLCNSFFDCLHSHVQHSSLEAKRSSQNTVRIDPGAVFVACGAASYPTLFDQSTHRAIQDFVTDGSQEDGATGSKEASTLELAETGIRAKTIPGETKSVKIGKDGGEIEVGGSCVVFEPGTFNDDQTITVTAKMDPDELPPAKEAVTSTLEIRAKNLQKKATIRLHTWVVAYNDCSDVDIMFYKKHIKKWEVFTTCLIGDSGFIEFQSQHFCSWVAVLRRAFSQSYIMRPIINFHSKDFVLALVQDTPLKITKLLNDLKGDYGHDMKTRKLNPIKCEKKKSVECCIDAIPNHFQFLDSATFTHDIRSIIEDNMLSYKHCRLECNSDLPSTSNQDAMPEAIRITLKVDGEEFRPPDCFSYVPPQSAESTRLIVNVSGPSSDEAHTIGDEQSTDSTKFGKVTGSFADQSTMQHGKNCSNKAQSIGGQQVLVAGGPQQPITFNYLNQRIHTNTAAGTIVSGGTATQNFTDTLTSVAANPPGDEAVKMITN